MVKRVLGDDPFADPTPSGEPPAQQPGPPRGAKSTRRSASASTPGKTQRPKRASTASTPAPKARASAPPRRERSSPATTGRDARPEPAPPAAPPVAPPEPAASTLDPPEAPRSLAPHGVDELPHDELPHDELLGVADLPPHVLRSASSDTEAPAGDAADPDEGGDIEEAIRDIEERLDKLLRASATRRDDAALPALDRVSDRLRAVATERTPGPVAERAEDASVFDVARELLSSDYYLRQWGRIAMRDRSEEVDDFGLDPKYEARWRPLFDFLYERWWRVETVGVEKVPATGRVALVANHSGAIPYDGVMLATALRKEHPVARHLRWLAEDFVFHFPFLGAFMNRIGAVRACQENAERLLRKESCVGLFPEGVKGISKLYRDRYRLQRFGRGGHVKLAIRTRTPIVPVTILGAEEVHPLVMPGGLLAKVFGLPYVPITPTFPLLGPLGMIPAPSKWKIFFGDPLPMDGYAPDAADDEVLVGRLNEKLRGTIQDTLDRALRDRRSVWKG